MRSDIERKRRMARTFEAIRFEKASADDVAVGVEHFDFA
jgi:hypothetical protein